MGQEIGLGGGFVTVVFNRILTFGSINTALARVKLVFR